jgi:hypothetical protein
MAVLAAAARSLLHQQQAGQVTLLLFPQVKVTMAALTILVQIMVLAAGAAQGALEQTVQLLLAGLAVLAPHLQFLDHQ